MNISQRRQGLLNREGLRGDSEFGHRRSSPFPFLRRAVSQCAEVVGRRWVRRRRRIAARRPSERPTRRWAARPFHSTTRIFRRTLCENELVASCATRRLRAYSFLITHVIFIIIFCTFPFKLPSWHVPRSSTRGSSPRSPSLPS